MGEVLTVTLAAAPGVLGALGTLWYVLRKQRRSDKSAAARIVWEDKEKEVEVQQMEQENAMGFWKAFAVERKKAHDADVKRLETQIGSLVRQLDESRRGHQRCKIQNARMAEVMRLKGLLSESETFDLLRAGEEDSDADETAE